MRNLVFLLFLVILGFVVVGWWLDWYSIAGVENTTGKHRVQIDIDSGKIKADLNKGQAKLQQTIQKVKEGGEPKPIKDAVKDAATDVKNAAKEVKDAVTSPIQPVKAEKPAFSAPRF